jgi:hypothetical protein
MTEVRDRILRYRSFDPPSYVSVADAPPRENVTLREA